MQHAPAELTIASGLSFVVLLRWTWGEESEDTCQVFDQKSSPLDSAFRGLAQARVSVALPSMRAAVRRLCSGVPRLSSHCVWTCCPVRCGWDRNARRRGMGRCRPCSSRVYRGRDLFLECSWGTIPQPRSRLLVKKEPGSDLSKIERLSGARLKSISPIVRFQ
jgi:hypothetical protein